MEKTIYYPLGSVVTLRGGIQKLMIIGRGMNVKNGEETIYFDYGAVPYPLGITEDRIVYFDHDSVEVTLFLGFDDDDNKVMDNIIHNYVTEHPDIKRNTNT